MLRRYLVLVFLGVLVFVSFSIPPAFAQGTPTSTELASAAWNALSQTNYPLVITTSDTCVQTYSKAALKAQSQIRGNPPVGAVSPVDAAKINNNAVLNDVAACIYAKATAYERQFQLQNAVRVFASLSSYKKARVWDPQVQAFWSPYDAGQKESGSPAMYQPLVKAAWAALTGKNFDYAFNITQECVAVFGRAAMRLQSQLRAQGAKIPVGTVSPQDADTINKNYLLNDVSACYFIKASALDGLGQKSKARQAYNDILYFTLARIYDPSWNGYWSPAEAAQKWLDSNK